MADADKAVKKKRKKFILLGVAALIVVFLAVSSLTKGKGPEAVVTTTEAMVGEIEQTIRTSGTVTTEKTKTYFSEVGIKISSVPVKAGDAVKEGDILLIYDEEAMTREKQLAELELQSTEGSYQNSIQSNNEKLGDLSEAKTNLEVLEQQIADTEAYIKNLENKIEQKQSDLAREGTLLQISLLDWQDQPGSEEYLNLQKLIQLNAYEQQNNKEIKGWQDELKAYNELLADYQEYRSEMKSQKNSAEAGRMNAGAKEELEAQNQTREIKAVQSLEDIEAANDGLLAEFDGVVTEVNAVEGSSMTVGAQLLKLESTEDVMVRITVTKYDLDKIAVGQTAVITIGGKQYQGQVSKINKMAEHNASGAAVVGTEIKITNPDSDVILGVEAQTVISTAQVTDAVIVPVGAVNVDIEGEFVYVVDENSILVKRPVITGISSDTMIQIQEGLSGGEQVVTDVTTGLSEGMTVLAMPQ